MEKEDLLRRYGKRIRRARRKLKMSPEYLAEQVGISRGHLLHVEKGQYAVSWVVYEHLNSILGLDGSLQRKDIHKRV